MSVPEGENPLKARYSPIVVKCGSGLLNELIQFAPERLTEIFKENEAV
jgi:hypothetical protein